MHGRFHSMARTIVVLLSLVLLTGLATPGGAVANDPKDVCKKGGWQTLVKEDGTPFKNQGDCVSYVAAHGGVPQPPPTEPPPPPPALTVEAGEPQFVVGQTCGYTVTFRNVTAGSYELHFKATIDGETWSFEGERFEPSEDLDYVQIQYNWNGVAQYGTSAPNWVEVYALSPDGALGALIAQSGIVYCTVPPR